MKIPQEKLPISKETIQHMAEQPSNAPEILQKTLYHHKAEISYLIDNYLPGRYRVSVYKVTDLVFSTDLQGTFKITYNATEFSGCELRETKLANFINVSFAIDKENLQVMLTGEVIRERDSFEEF